MPLTARDVMQTDLVTASPELPLAELERLLIGARISGVPVVDDGKLVGIVSRSDIVRQLCIEQSLAEQVSEYFHGDPGLHETEADDLPTIGDQVGERIEQLHVRDVMIRDIVTVTPDAGLAEIAHKLVDQRIHRLLVTHHGELQGLVSALDLVRLFAEGRAQVD